MSDTLRLRAMAKLNLFLRVTGNVEGGFHELQTVFHSIGLSDVVELSPAPPGAIEVDLHGPPSQRGHLPGPEGDLVTIAASRLSRLAKRAVGASITVTKNIPVGSGMGGASADAAATILGLNDLWNLGLSRESIFQVAAELGSDVSFCIEGGTTFATSRGTELTRLHQPPPMWFVLGMSDHPLMTADVFEAWDRSGHSGAATPTAMIESLERGDLREIASCLHNDLYAPALTLRSEIATSLRALLDAGALGVAMSGSGPTVFGIARDESHALGITRRVQGTFSRVEVAVSAPAGVSKA